MSAFRTYHTLDAEKKDIRLFRLRTDTSATNGNEAQISGSIGCASLLDPPAYTALSYVWEEPVLKSQTHLDGGTHLPITENLSIALAHIVEFTPLVRQSRMLAIPPLTDRNRPRIFQRDLLSRYKMMLTT